MFQPLTPSEHPLVIEQSAPISAERALEYILPAFHPETSPAGLNLAKPPGLWDRLLGRGLSKR